MNSARNIYVIGAGGHAKVVVSTLRECGFTVKAIFDDDPQKWGKDFLGVFISGATSQIKNLPKPRAVIAIGENHLRKEVASHLALVEWVTAVHPTASVHPSVTLGSGTVIFAGAVIQPDTRIGSHCIVNTASSIDHDCCLEDYVHIAPGVHLAGGVQLKEGVFMGIGSVAIPNISIGTWTAIGAGGVVVGNLGGNLLAVGVPASPIKKRW